MHIIPLTESNTINFAQTIITLVKLINSVPTKFNEIYNTSLDQKPIRI